MLPQPTLTSYYSKCPLTTSTRQGDQDGKDAIISIQEKHNLKDNKQNHYNVIYLSNKYTKSFMCPYLNWQTLNPLPKQCRIWDMHDFMSKQNILH